MGNESENVDSVSAICRLYSSPQNHSAISSLETFELKGTLCFTALRSLGSEEHDNFILYNEFVKFVAGLLGSGNISGNNLVCNAMKCFIEKDYLLPVAMMLRDNATNTDSWRTWRDDTQQGLLFFCFSGRMVDLLIKRHAADLLHKSYGGQSVSQTNIDR